MDAAVLLFFVVSGALNIRERVIRWRNRDKRFTW